MSGSPHEPRPYIWQSNIQARQGDCGRVGAQGMQEHSIAGHVRDPEWY